MKRTSLIAATAAAAALALAGCSGSATSTDASTPASPAGEAYSIGITQITTHTALDSAREGFKKAFEDAGIQVKYDEQNAQGDQATATSIASKFASSDLDELTFSDAVARHSEGPKVADGTLETVRWRDLAGPWREAVQGLTVGEISEPFPIQGKWAVLKLLDRKEASPRPAEQVEEEVREALLRPKMEERFREYMADLRSRALIEKRL